MSKDNQNKTKSSGVVEISVPDNFASYIAPFITLIAAIMISAALLISANQISGKLTGSNVAGTSTTTTGTTKPKSANDAEGISELLKDVVDKETMKSCIASGKYASVLSRDEGLASSIGISGTPGFYVNNKLFAGAYSFTDMKADADGAINGTFVSPKDSKVTMAKIKEIFNTATVKFGNADSKLIFIEVSDPSCPYCHFAAGKNPELSNQQAQFKLVANGGTYLSPVQEMKKLVTEGKAAMAYIYSNGHGNGTIATQALYCAFENGKYWEAHDILMSSAGYSLMNGN